MAETYRYEWMPGLGKFKEHLVPRPSTTSGLDGKGSLSKQIDGDHYKKLKIQPLEYSMANGLDACQHSVVKYVTRFRDKGGVRDLEKAKHILDILVEMENAKQKKSDGERTG